MRRKTFWRGFAAGWAPFVVLAGVNWLVDFGWALPQALWGLGMIALGAVNAASGVAEWRRARRSDRVGGWPR